MQWVPTGHSLVTSATSTASYHVQLMAIINVSFFQGIMFGYATDETDEAMPLTLLLAHKLNKTLANLRRDGTLPWVWPDGKSQVTIEYKFDRGACVPIRVHTVVVSTQHSPTVSQFIFITVSALFNRFSSRLPWKSCAKK